MDLKSSQTEVVGFDSTFSMADLSTSTDQNSEDKCTMTSNTEQSDFVDKFTSTGDSVDKEVRFY